MADRKLTTAETLAQARQQDAGGAAEPDKPDEAPEAPAPAETAKPAETLAAAEAGPTPKSTKDILAAARAQAGGGAKEKGETPSPAAAKPAAGAPKSTKDILAAARAQSGGKAGAAAKPAAESAAKPAPATSGERPSVQEMLQRARGKSQVEAAKEQPSVVVPEKPARARVRPDAEPRRNFLLALVATPFAAGWTAFTAATAAATLGTLRFMLPNVMVEPPSRFKVGPPDDYAEGAVTTKWKSEFAVWITNQLYKGEQQIYALSTVCTHLGCTPNWLEAERKFKCPCHGSGFYPDGVNFEGPAPRPLERYGISVAADGMLEVDKSVKFQEEMGQWADEASFVPVG